MNRAAKPTSGQSFGPEAMAAAEAATWKVSSRSPARRVALMIAVGIGLHNFAEGLAIGQSSSCSGSLRRPNVPSRSPRGLILGVLAGFATDAIVTAAGA